MVEQRRLWLEVLKWLPPEDILLIAARVCRLWRTLGEMDELWREFVGDGCHEGRLLDVFRYDIYRPVYLPLVLGNTVHRLSLATWQSPPLSSFPDLSILPGTRLLFLHNNDLLIAGGWNTSQCFLLSSRQSVISPFPNLPCDKAHHGLVEVCKLVFSFGGYTDGKETDDTLTTAGAASTWAYKAAMTTPRCDISPAARGKFVYIAGGADTSIERYDMETDAFEVLPIRLVRASAATVLIYNLLLVVLTPKERLIVTLSNFEKVSYCSSGLWWSGQSDQTPFAYRGKGYMSVHVNNTVKVYQFHFLTMSFLRREVET